MNYRYNIMVLVAATLIAATCFADTSNEKMVKNFAKINDYLEKKVTSDNLEANFEKVEQWKDSILSMFSDKSLKEAQKLFLTLPETLKTCQNYTHGKLLSKCDEGLSDEAHLKDRDYPLRRIDRILEQVGYKHVRRCLLDKNRPQMKFAFKQLAYAQIDSDLSGKVATDDPEANMKAAEEILEGLANKNGSYSQALKQLVSLKTILDENSCTELGLEIVLKNSLAIQGKTGARRGTFRRIDHLVHHYSRKHATVCISIYKRNCLAHLHQLDAETYRRVLALAAAPHLKGQLFNKMQQYEDLVAEANSKQVDEDFSVPSIADCEGGPTRLGTEQMVMFLKAATKQDPRSRFLELIVHDKTGQLVLDRKKVAEIYVDYIVRPCKKFNTILGPDMDVFNYNWAMMDPHELPLHFRLLRTAVSLCKSLYSDKQSSFDLLIFRLEP